MDFSRIVRTRMTELHISATKLARATGYSTAHICDLLAGDRRWNETSMSRVADALGIQIRFDCDEQRANGAV